MGRDFQKALNLYHQVSKNKDFLFVTENHTLEVALLYYSKWHTGKAGLWTHGLEAWTLDDWTLGLWTLGLWTLGLWTTVRLNLDPLTLDDWTLEFWTLGL